MGSLAAETAGDLKSLLKELVDELAFQEGSRLTLLGQNRKLQGDIDRAKNDAARAVISRPALQRKKERKQASKLASNTKPNKMWEKKNKSSVKGHLPLTDPD